MSHSNQKEYNNYIFVAWMISVIGFFASLYFSEIRQFEPCTLCWYQRILLYPLTILLGVAYVRRDDGISLYAMIFSALGSLVAIYQYTVQTVAAFAKQASECGPIPCTEIHISWFGFITIPLLGFFAFLTIFICSLIVWIKTSRGKK